MSDLLKNSKAAGKMVYIYEKYIEKQMPSATGIGGQAASAFYSILQ